MFGDFKKNCRVKLKESNVAGVERNKEDHDQCFIAKTNSNGSVNFHKDWIIDSEYNHHLNGDVLVFTTVRPHEGNGSIIIANNTICSMEQEGSVIIKIKEDDQIKLNNNNQVSGIK